MTNRLLSVLLTPEIVAVERGLSGSGSELANAGAEGGEHSGGDDPSGSRELIAVGTRHFGQQAMGAQQAEFEGISVSNDGVFRKRGRMGQAMVWLRGHLTVTLYGIWFSGTLDEARLWPAQRQRA
jgi:hypothetical protein